MILHTIYQHTHANNSTATKPKPKPKPTFIGTFKRSNNYIWTCHSSTLPSLPKSTPTPTTTTTSSSSAPSSSTKNVKTPKSLTLPQNIHDQFQYFQLLDDNSIVEVENEVAEQNILLLKPTLTRYQASLEESTSGKQNNNVKKSKKNLKNDEKNENLARLKSLEVNEAGVCVALFTNGVFVTGKLKNKLENDSMVKNLVLDDIEVESQVELDVTGGKYDLEQTVQLFISNYGYFLFYFDKQGNYKIQHWNERLSSVTVDAIIYPKETSTTVDNELLDLKHICLLSRLDVLLLLTSKGHIFAINIHSLHAPKALQQIRFTACEDANSLSLIVRFRELTRQYLKCEEAEEQVPSRKSSSNNHHHHHHQLSSSGQVISTVDSVKQQELAHKSRLSLVKISRMSEQELLDTVQSLNQIMLIKLAAHILHQIHLVELSNQEDDNGNSGNSNKIVHYPTISFVYHKVHRLERVPKEQVHCLLVKLLQNQHLPHAATLIAKCCSLLSNFDGQRATGLPLEVLPILVKEFTPDQIWMIDACNVIIDLHLRNIVGNETYLNSVKELKQKVALFQQMRETEVRLCGMIQALATAPRPKQLDKPGGIELVNF